MSNRVNSTCCQVPTGYFDDRDILEQTSAVHAIVTEIDVPLTTMAKTKMSTTTKMAAMTKKLPGTYQESTGQGWGPWLVHCL